MLRLPDHRGLVLSRDGFGVRVPKDKAASAAPTLSPDEVAKMKRRPFTVAGFPSSYSRQQGEKDLKAAGFECEAVRCFFSRQVFHWVVMADAEAPAPFRGPIGMIAVFEGSNPLTAKQKGRGKNIDMGRGFSSFSARTSSTSVV